MTIVNAESFLKKLPAIASAVLLASLSEVAFGDGTGRCEHWAFQRPAWDEPPAVKDPSWGINAVDAFILARIEAAGGKFFKLDGTECFLHDYLDGNKIDEPLLVTAPEKFSAVRECLDRIE